LVVLDGELTIGARHLAAGSYELSSRHSFHEPASAQKDCLILLQYGE
jgi:hypothetical protein